MSQKNTFPVKSHELQNHHMDSTIWNDFEFRDDDIIIGTYAKAGTTWMQQIIGQLIFSGDGTISSHDYSPWLELRVIPEEEKLGMLAAQKNRRFIKTHLPLDALTFHPPAKYIYVTRDFPDIVWSLHNHLFNALDMFYEMINDTPGRVGSALPRPPDDPYEFWQLMLNDDYPMWSFWDNVRTWWEYRDLPNMHLVHFNDLKADLEGEIRRLAAFLAIDVDESHWDAIVEHSTFSWMKANAEQMTPMAGEIFAGGAQTFINKGTNKRWKDVLSEADITTYHQIAVEKLGQECAQWVFTGKGV